jgi:hypothetical protein
MESTAITVDSNEIHHSGSEGIHITARADGVASVYTITDNYIHDIGNPADLGPQICGTPSSMILGDSSPTGTGGDGTGNYR